MDELLKVYQGILDGKLLSAESVQMMFQPHLENTTGLDNREEYLINHCNAIFNAIPSDVPVSFGYGGLVNLAPIPGRRAAHSLSWSGMPNCY